MGVLDRINTRAAALAAQKAPSPRGRLRVISTPMDRWDIPEPTNIQNQVSLYTRLSWVQIAVSISSQTCAATPYRVRRGMGEDRQEVANHPFVVGEAGVYGSLRRPNPLQSRSEFLEATFSWRKGAGNCYWWLNRVSPDMPPAEMWIIPAYNIQPVPDGRMGLAGYLYDDGTGNKIALESWEVVHFKTFNPLNKYVGLSPIEALMYDAVGDIGAQEYGARFYEKGAIKGRGILAFSDHVEDGKWRRLKEDWKEQHGGRQNNPVIFLRGVGAGGVQWMSTMLSQAETKYLEVRNFTKEEIYEIFAPGLSSMLAVNSTEANSVSGKDTFLSMCVYPQNVAVAEKLDSDILPAYGTDLDGEFDDVRRVDTDVELRQQEAYERTHTVEEVRAKYYQDKPLGDGRDKLLPAEIGKGMTDGRAPEDKPPPPQIIQQPDALEEAQKRLDKQRWYKKAINHIAAGRSLDTLTFTPDYLSDDDTMRIRAALKRAQTEADVKRAFGEA